MLSYTFERSRKIELAFCEERFRPSKNQTSLFQFALAFAEFEIEKGVILQVQ